MPSYYHLDSSQFSLWIILLNGQICKGEKRKKGGEMDLLNKACCWTGPAFVLFSFTLAKHTLFLQKAFSWALIALASANPAELPSTSPALPGHSTTSSSPAKKPQHPAQQRTINISTGANQNTLVRKVNISLLWFQRTHIIPGRIPDYIPLNNIWDWSKLTTSCLVLRRPQDARFVNSVTLQLGDK